MTQRNSLQAESLADWIRRQIGNSPLGAIAFRDFMEACLYHKTWGYYNAERVKIGKEGDYYTSAAIGGLTGEMLAETFCRWIDAARSQGRLKIAEWGGGDGKMADALLRRMQNRHPRQYDRLDYVLIERSPFHRRLQKETLALHGERIRFMTEEEWFHGSDRSEWIVFSNELLDAFPVHRLRKIGTTVKELYVAWDESTQAFAETFVELKEGPLLRYLADEGISLAEGQTIEINPAAADWIAKMGRWLKSGHLVTIDYGDTAKELYAPHRFAGTLMCYYRHRAHDNPYIHLGEQDITAHVNFSACIRAGREAGFNDWSLRTQRQFLLETGILEELRDHVSADPFSPVVRRNRAIRQLLLGDRMGELFKVLIQTKKR